jgi:hypothetical protein
MRGLWIAQTVVSLMVLGSGRTAFADKQACGDAYYAVQQLRDEGKLDDALIAVGVCVNESCAPFVRDDCSRWKGEIEAELLLRAATVSIEAVDQDGEPIREASATLDGAPWLARLDGQVHSLAAGQHVIEVRLEGEAPQRRSILVRPREKNQRFVFEFDTRSALSRGDGPLPWVLGGIGVAALIAGAVTGGLVIDAYLTTQDECDDATRTCSREGLDAQERGRSLGPATTALLVGGAVLAGTGLIWRLSDSGEPAPTSATLLLSPVVSVGQVGLMLRYSE